MRTIGVVTTGRADFGIYTPILHGIRASEQLQLQLFATGMHLSPEFGLTFREIEAEGFDIQGRVEMLLSSDTPEGIAKSIGLGVLGFAQLFASQRPDLLLVLGDRFEMMAAATASLPFNIPLAHIHGGESTEGLIDEPLRHSITKMSHLHFVTTARYRDRVIQMGEAPWRVTLSGAPSIDNLRSMTFLSKEELASRIEMTLDVAPLLVTFHPVTLEFEKTCEYIEELIAALNGAERPVVFTYPNSDTSGRIIIEAMDDFVRNHKDARVVFNLGTRAYFSLMRYSAAMVGNSSSGIIEAATFGLPVVNIGSRQRGRVRGKNVLDADSHREAILKAINEATSTAFRQCIEGMTNPYGDGQASGRIIDVLSTVALDRKLIQKSFYDRSEAR